MTVDLAVALPTLVAFCALIAALAAGLRWIKRWIKEVAKPAEAAARQVKTSNGRTMAEYIEGTARDITGMKESVSELSKTAQENRETSIAALTLARHLNERFDSHLVNEHGVHSAPSNHEEN